MTSGPHARDFAAFDGVRVCVTVNFAAGSAKGAGDACQIFQWVKLRLARQRNAGTRVEVMQWRPLRQVRVADACTLHRREFTRETRFVIVWRAEKVASDPSEITLDFFVFDDGFDAVDCSHMAFRGEARAVHAMDPLDVFVAAIEGAGKMRGGHAGHAPANLPIVKHDDAFARLGQMIGGAQPCDTRTDNAYVGP